jgi:hypothetical protein
MMGSSFCDYLGCCAFRSTAKPVLRGQETGSGTEPRCPAVHRRSREGSSNQRRDGEILCRWVKDGKM